MPNPQFSQDGYYKCQWLPVDANWPDRKPILPLNILSALSPWFSLHSFGARSLSRVDILSPHCSRLHATYTASRLYHLNLHYGVSQFLSDYLPTDTDKSSALPVRNGASERLPQRPAVKPLARRLLRGLLPCSDIFGKAINQKPFLQDMAIQVMTENKQQAPSCKLGPLPGSTWRIDKVLGRVTNPQSSKSK